MSLKQTITEYLKGKDFVHKGELGRKAVLEWGYENENLGRRCRELENEGKVERLLKKNEKTGVSEVWYRLKMPNSAPRREFCCLEAWRGQPHNNKCFKLKL